VTLLTCAPEPGALRTALRDLAVASDGKRRRTWAVVGALPGVDRDELMDLGRFLVRLDISALVVVGEAGPVHAGAVLEGSWGEESRHVDTDEQATALLRAEAASGDVVLVAGADALVAAVTAALGDAA
jgi:UDP-N-acetylmuramoyl-tripeptide--D-alanyl-D-alanine ligase